MSRPSPQAVAVRLRRLLGIVWMRALLFTLAAVLFALAARFIGEWVPFRLVIELGQNSVDSLLQIIATAMLTATTFSITAMVTAYSSATTIATPRSTKLLIADPTSQTALSTFVGAFVFSLVGIIALSTGYYNEQGRTILFFGTLVVIAIVVVTLLRWIGHLARFGRMSDVIDRVEDAASRALLAFAENPTLGAQRLVRIPPDASPVFVASGEYVLAVDVARLHGIGEEHGCDIYVRAMPGTIADGHHPLAFVSGRASDAVRAELRAAFTLGRHRDFEQDPRFGVIALTEIGSRALSPATNDPGTAVEVIAALQRVFTRALLKRAETTLEPGRARVWIAPVRLEELVSDAFRPLARDGAAVIEVQIRLQKCLAALADIDPDAGPVFAAASHEALRRATRGLDRADARLLKQMTRKGTAHRTDAAGS